MSKPFRDSRTDWRRVNATQDEQIDYSDVGELGDDFFHRAEWHPAPKKPVTLRVDADVLDWFKRQGRGYQTRINQLLRAYMEAHGESDRRPR